MQTGREPSKVRTGGGLPGWSPTQHDTRAGRNRSKRIDSDRQVNFRALDTAKDKPPSPPPL